MPDSAAEPRWLSAADIDQINRLVVAKTGEDHVLMSADLLESAAAGPRNLFGYEGIRDIIVLGVRLIEAVGKNHCFEQGNKRTAFHAGLTFMELNEVFVSLPDSETSAELITKVIIGEAQADDLVRLFRQHQI